MNTAEQIRAIDSALRKRLPSSISHGTIRELALDIQQAIATSGVQNGVDYFVEASP